MISRLRLSHNARIVHIVNHDARPTVMRSMPGTAWRAVGSEHGSQPQDFTKSFNPCRMTTRDQSALNRLTGIAAEATSRSVEEMRVRYTGRTLTGQGIYGFTAPSAPPAFVCRRVMT